MNLMKQFDYILNIYIWMNLPFKLYELNFW
jgi:hypothetical protein